MQAHLGPRSSLVLVVVNVVVGFESLAFVRDASLDHVCAMRGPCAGLCRRRCPRTRHDGIRHYDYTARLGLNGTCAFRLLWHAPVQFLFGASTLFLPPATIAD